MRSLFEASKLINLKAEGEYYACEFVILKGDAEKSCCRIADKIEDFCY